MLSNNLGFRHLNPVETIQLDMRLGRPYLLPFRSVACAIRRVLETGEMSDMFYA